jgi:hypothetical protein
MWSADALVAERGQVAEGLLDGDRVVGGDPREVQVLGRGVHQHHRQPQLQQPQIVLVRGVRLGVMAPGEHDSGDLLLQQHLHVVRLGQAAGRARTEHRGEPALRQRAADHLGQRREDRVLQLRQHQADQPGTFTAQLRRPLVSQHVQRGKDGRARPLGHAGFTVEHPADRGLTDPGLLRHFRKPSRHAARIPRPLASWCKSSTTSSGLA